MARVKTRFTLPLHNITDPIAKRVFLRIQTEVNALITEQKKMAAKVESLEKELDEAKGRTTNGN